MTLSPLFARPRRLRLAACALAVLGSAAALAEDTDIFHVRSTSASGNPNVMILVDNSANWSRASQDWPDTEDGRKLVQGESEVAAIKNVLGTIRDQAGNPLKLSAGLAGYAGGGTSVGGYIRFGVRDMTANDGENKEALFNILDHIRSDVNATTEKVNDPGESAAMYEVYKYFMGLAPFRGGLASGNDPAANVDIANNAGNPSASKPTAHAQGLTTATEYAIGSTGRYQPPPFALGCNTNALIMVVNNTNGSLPTGDQSYEGVSAGNALPAIPGVNSISWTDEWARFLYQNGISVYIIDVFNKQQNPAYSKVLRRAAEDVGGGKYYEANNQAEIETAIADALIRINGQDSNFAAAALPLSATNRSQYLNQVFIGMFAPDTRARPRWLGNLKQYKLGITDTGAVQLSDMTGANAINTRTGFVQECAVSAWTRDSGTYWQNVDSTVNVSANTCTAFPTITVDGTTETGSAWSDLPDGPEVAKGGVAQVIRRGNKTATSPSSSVLDRKILTYSSSATSQLTAVTTSNTGWSSELLNWASGFDDTSIVGTSSNSEFLDTVTSPRARASVHGDVVHSRPLAVNQGKDAQGKDRVTLYYGANDGLYRAVDVTTGRERWAFVAPEHYGRFERLRTNTPNINFPNVDGQPKDYFMDGSTGLYQNLDSSKVWIFTSMRRGGRRIYAFDVTDPDDPKLKWRAGCPNLTDNDGCAPGSGTGDMTGIGQTWSQPTVARIKGQDQPVVIVGGGYDPCEDADSTTTGCNASTRKGAVVYALNANDGTLLRAFKLPSNMPLDGSVVADVALADRNGDGYVDLAYAATTTGSIYRINFTDASYNALAPDAWGIRRIAYTSGGGRKFLNMPALMPSGNAIYVALGSGDREKPLHTHYPYTTPVTNRFYVLVDPVADPAVDPTEVNLDSTDAGMRDYTAETTCESPAVTPTSSYKGWFMNLPDRGEQTVTSAVIAAGMVTFSTNRPLGDSEATCSMNANLGRAKGYWLNILNGSGAIGAGNATCGGVRSAEFPQGGLVPSPTLASVVIDGTIQTIVLGAIQRTGGASSSISPQAVKPPIKAKRRTIYWRSNQAN